MRNCVRVAPDPGPTALDIDLTASVDPARNPPPPPAGTAGDAGGRHGVGVGGNEGAEEAATPKDSVVEFIREGWPGRKRQRAPPITNWHGCFHVFISHREGEGPDGVHRKLCDGMMKISKSLPGMLWLVTEGYGRWPVGARVPDGWVQHQVRIFEESLSLHPVRRNPLLNDLKSNRGIAARAFMSSQLFCPILSWGDNDEGSVGQLASISPSQGRDRVDPFLLELALASYILKTDLGQTRAVFPVSYGERRDGGAFTPFPRNRIDSLSNLPCMETNRCVLGLLQEMGHVPVDPSLVLEATVQGIVSEIACFPGVDLSEAGIAHAANEVLEALASFRDIDQHAAAAFSQPYTLEMITWLGEVNLLPYAPTLVQQAIDSLQKIKELSHQELGAICNHHAKRRGEEPRIGDMHTLARLARGLETDPRAFPMSRRLRVFKDVAVSAVSALVATRAIHTASASRLGKAFISLPPIWAGVATLNHFLWGFVHTDAGYQPCANVRTALEPRRIWGGYLAFDVLLIAVVLVSVPLIWLTDDPKYCYAAAYLCWAGSALVMFFSAIALIIQCSLSEGEGVEGCEGGLGVVCFPWASLVGALCSYLQTHVLGYYERFFFIFLCSFTLTAIAWSFVFEQYLTIHGSNDPTLLYLLFGFSFVPPIVGALLFRKYRKNRKYAFSLIDQAAYEDAWIQALEPSSDQKIEMLHNILADIQGMLQRQRAAHYKRIPLFQILSEPSEEQKYWSSRFSRGSSQKIRQPHDDIDRLFEDACQINATFQAWVSNAALANGRTGTHLPGPAKKPVRAIEKLVRCYNRDAGCLTDLVRCSLVFDSLDDIMDGLLKLMSLSEIGLAETDPQAETVLKMLNRQLFERYERFQDPQPSAHTYSDLGGLSSHDWSAQGFKKKMSKTRRCSSEFAGVCRTDSTESIPAREGGIGVVNRLGSLESDTLSKDTRSTSSFSNLRTLSEEVHGVERVRSSFSTILEDTVFSKGRAHHVRTHSLHDAWIESGEGGGHDDVRVAVTLFSQLNSTFGGTMDQSKGERLARHVSDGRIEPDGEKKSPWMRVVEIKDRHFTQSGSAGYRDCNIKVEVAWEKADPTKFIPICEWDKMRRRHAETNGVESMVCEIQLLLSSIYHLKMSGSHKKYVQFRNIVTNP